MTGCFDCFLGYPKPTATQILNVDGGVVQRGLHHALILLKVKNPNEADNQNINLVFDLCWKLRVNQWTDRDLAEQSQKVLSIDGEGARLPRAVQSSGCQTDTLAHNPTWRLKSNLKVGEFFKTAIDLERYRNQDPWNPKYCNCHDFVVEQLPLLTDGAGAQLVEFLENGVLCSRKRTEVMFRNRGACLAKIAEWYVRYIGGLSGSSQGQKQQDLKNPTAMIYGGYNRHPLQEAQKEHQICPVDWEIVEASVLFRLNPMGHCNVAPLGITVATVTEDYDFKANYLKEFE
jgi:hypothetical protein